MTRHQPTLFVFVDTHIYYTNISGQMCSETDPVRWASLSHTDSMTCVNDVTNQKRVNHLLKACTLLFAHEATVAHIFLGLVTYREFPVKPAGQKFFRQQPIRAAQQYMLYTERYNYTTYWQRSRVKIARPFFFIFFYFGECPGETHPPWPLEKGSHHFFF